MSFQESRVVCYHMMINNKIYGLFENFHNKNSFYLKDERASSKFKMIRLMMLKEYFNIVIDSLAKVLI